MLNHNNQNQGFALLMALIVVSVVISISLSVLDLTIKQLRLSTNSIDSETAFSAANAGLECARYWRELNNTEIETGLTINPTCFGASPGVVGAVNRTSLLTGGGTAYQYTLDFTWSALNPSDLNRCSRINILVISSNNINASELTDISAIMPGYPGGSAATKSCEAGGRCTVISSQGFNRSCANRVSEGTVQREVLLEL